MPESVAAPDHDVKSLAGDCRRSVLLAAFYCAGFALVGGGFILYTSTDPVLGRDTGAGSIVSQLMLGVFYLLGAMLLIVNQNAWLVIKRVWPILLLPMLALTSALWSPDPALTLRRAIAFTGTIVFGLSLGSSYRYRDLIALVVISLSLVMALSFVLAFLDPVNAIHQPNDAIQAVHAGSWRGIFAHRNTLGLWAAASVVLIALAGVDPFGRRWLWGAALAIAGVCLISTGSSAGLTIVALAGICYVALTSILDRPAELRVAMVVFWLLAAVVVVLGFEEIARFGLGLLGRDSDLSGRTELWSYLIAMVQPADKPLGLGYFVGTLVLDQRLSSATQIRSVNAHNGFLEAYIYFGWLGVVLAVGLVAWLLASAARFAITTRRGTGRLSVLPAITVLLATAHNMIESTIVSPNNLNNVLLAIMAAVFARAAIESEVYPLAGRVPTRVPVSSGRSG